MQLLTYEFGKSHTVSQRDIERRVSHDSGAGGCEEVRLPNGRGDGKWGDGREDGRGGGKWGKGKG